MKIPSLSVRNPDHGDALEQAGVATGCLNRKQAAIRRTGEKDALRARSSATSPKGLRHAFGVHAVLSGVPLPLVQEWLGHEDIAMTAIYLAVMGAEERAIARRMW